MKTYSIFEVSVLTGVSQKRIRRAIAAGELTSTQKSNRHIIVRKDITSWKRNTATEYTGRESAKRIYDDTVRWIDIRSEMPRDGWLDTRQRNGLNFVDLFSGAGGMGCGLVMAGWSPLYSTDILPVAVETYRDNFCVRKNLADNVIQGDIRDETVKKQLYKTVKKQTIHLITGGFPCQGFSLAGHRVVADKRNGLYLEMLEVVKHIKPNFVLMENVEGLRSMLGGKIEEQIMTDYRRIGYKINVAVLNAVDYGVPQYRRRVIFIANRIGKENFYPSSVVSPEEYKTVADGIGRFADIPEDQSINHIFTKHRADMIEGMKKLPEGQSLYNNYSDGWKRPFWLKPSCTVKENHGGVNVHPLSPRVMTPRELAALQSFPDDFIFQGAKKWQLVQIGNAVPPLTAKAIGLAIEKALKR
ncbi:MAG: DNA cytosine methyltransferase [Planctomycetaceae bacterium]|jgi:DNA (cytosine-5)-methyltransferase 1|nr:DNA cytosine methyltransferase [Planctomycetaceae bacterium]